MLHRTPETRLARWAVYAGAALVLLLVLTVDDWSRDFVGSRAEISAEAPDALRPLISDRPSAELEQAVRWAAKRIGSWEFVGSAGDETHLKLVFVRRQRILRIKDDIVVDIEDRGSERVLTATSESRLKIGDLGRNPRNLERLLEEVRDVLAGAASRPASTPEWT